MTNQGTNGSQLQVQAANRMKYINSGTIWMFWEGEPSELISKCIETIRANNTHRRVVVLSKETLPLFLDPEDYPTFYDEENSGKLRQGIVDDFSSIQYLADWVRIVLLEKYGGVWFDASVICTSAVEMWMAKRTGEEGEELTMAIDENKITMFNGCFNPKVHGNWAMAVARNGHPLLKAWREEFASILREAGPRNVPTKFCTEAFEMYPSLEEIWFGNSYSGAGPPLPYLWVYLCLQVVLIKQPNLHATVFLHQSANGPMYRNFKINVEEGVTNTAEISMKKAEHLASLPLNESDHDQFFIKLVGSDRRPIQSHMASGNYQEGSAIDCLCRVPRRSIRFGSFLRRSVISPMDVVMME